MNSRTSTIRISEKRRRTGSRQTPVRISTPTASLLLTVLLFSTSPSLTTTNWETNSQNDSKRTIQYWAVEGMSPTAELSAAAAAAVVRRNVISGAAIFTVGDAAAQLLTNSKQSKQRKSSIVPTADTQSIAMEESTLQNVRQTNKIATAFASLDKNRLYSSAVLGAIWSGFCVPFIYGTVEKTFPGKADIRQILIKVLVTCSILSTIGNYATMYARRFAALYTTYQFDKTSSLRLKWFSNPFESTLLFLAIFKSCFQSCNRDIGEIIVDDLKIWPLYDLTCYSLIPPSWRPITTSIMSSGWAMYMSVVSAKEENDEDSSEASFAIPISTTNDQPSVKIEPIQVTPLVPFPKKAAFKEATNRLIRVKGGESNNVDNVPPSDTEDD